MSCMLCVPPKAARVTRACTKLKKTASEIRSRPYNYKDTPQLDLDSILSYTTGLNLSVCCYKQRVVVYCTYLHNP